jgi:hypothetical protein
MDLNWQPTSAEKGDHIDAPGGQSPPGASATPSAPPATEPGHGVHGLRRFVATAALAIGLLTIGGVSVVMAASPSPSSTPSASSGTTTTTPKHNCPNMGSGTNGSHAGSMTNPSSSPSN